MADEQDPSNDVGDGGDASELDYEDSPSTAATAAANNSPTISSLSDYDDENEPIEDYVVKMVVNEQPDGPISPDLVDAFVTDINGNVIGTKPTIYDSLNGFTSTVFNELSENGTSIAGADGKRWWGWSTTKLIIFGLIALCILGIILAIVFFLLSKKKKNKRSPAAGTTTTTKAVVTKTNSPDPKYQPVPNV